MNQIHLDWSHCLLGRLPHRKFFQVACQGKRLYGSLSHQCQPQCQSQHQGTTIKCGKATPRNELLNFWMRAATLWIKKNKRSQGRIQKIILKGDVPLEYLHQDHAHHEVLRRGRVHLDMAANVLFRYFFRTLDLDCIYFYLFVDASPQWRGRELYAASFDMMGIVGTALFWQRRLFTQIAISRCMYSALGKTAALLWQILLQVGGEYWAMRAFCNNVAGVTTDLGTEKAIPDHPDILIPFFKSLGIHVPASARRQLHLFPIALASIGWFHLWDGILKVWSFAACVVCTISEGAQGCGAFLTRRCCRDQACIQRCWIAWLCCANRHYQNASFHRVAVGIL